MKNKFLSVPYIKLKNFLASLYIFASQESNSIRNSPLIITLKRENKLDYWLATINMRGSIGVGGGWVPSWKTYLTHIC